MIDTTTIEMLSGLAERLHKAGDFGAEVTSSDKAFAVLLKGHELGFTPMASASSAARHAAGRSAVIPSVPGGSRRSSMRVAGRRRIPAARLLDDRYRAATGPSIRAPADHGT